MNLEKPLVHLNGTSGDALLEGYANAGSALRKALDALGDAAPNARDYYPLGDASFAAARREHESRVERLRSVLDELQVLVEHVEDSMEARRR